MVDPNNLARWKREFENLYDTLMRGREQFDAWFEETVLIEADIKTENDEFHECVADIKKDQRHYRQVIEQIPKPEEFSAEELEKRTEKVSQLLDLAGEITLMGIHVPRKVEKLRFLLKSPMQ